MEISSTRNEAAGTKDGTKELPRKVITGVVVLSVEPGTGTGALPVPYPFQDLPSRIPISVRAEIPEDSLCSVRMDPRITYRNPL